MPTWNLVALRVFEGLSLALLAGVVWFCVVRPWRRTGKLSLDGKFLLGDGSSIGMPVVVSRPAAHVRPLALAASQNGWSGDSRGQT